VATHRVECGLAIAHDDEAQLLRNRGEHASFASHDGVDDDELRLNDELQVANLFIEAMVVIDEAVSVVLDTDVILDGECDGGPRVRLELGAIDEEVGFGDRLGRKDVIAEPARMGEGDLDLRLLFEVIVLGPGALEHGVVVGLAERCARGKGDAAALADRELFDALTASVAQRHEDAFDELGPRVGVGKLRARRDDVRFDERAPRRREAELLEPVANDLPNPPGVVLVAVPNDDARLFGDLHDDEG